MTGIVYIIDNDQKPIVRLLKSVGVEARVFASPIGFLDALEPGEPACVITELRLPEMSGLELLAQMRERGVRLPVLIVTAYGDAAGAVRALKSGAVEFFEKPVRSDLFLDRVQFWIRACSDDIAEVKSQTAIAEKIAKLSGRERQVLAGVLNGMSNKEIARALEISTKAIELYRSKLMGKMGAPSLAVLIREAISYELGSKLPRWQPHVS